MFLNIFEFAVMDGVFHHSEHRIDDGVKNGSAHVINILEDKYWVFIVFVSSLLLLLTE